MKKNILLLSVFLFVSACGTPASTPPPSLETIVAATLQSMTASAPENNGLPVSFNNISFRIPVELNASAVPSVNTNVEYPYINGGGGPMAEHVVFEFTNFPVAGQAQIMVFKSSEYAAYGPPLQEAVTALLAGQDAIQPPPDTLIIDRFSVKTQPIRFQNGHGLRYLTEVLTGIAPINNQEIFYYYQGITDDGAYFVSAFFHVNSTILVKDGLKTSLTPPDGIPFDWESAHLNYPKYLSDVSQKLESIPPENYSPSLLLLDRLIESIQVTNP